MTQPSFDFSSEPDQEAFDTTLLQSAMTLAARDGWSRLSLVEAAREAGLPVDAVRARFPFRHSVLFHLGRIADESALRDDGMGSSVRERLFDMLMRRLDVFQQYREGVRAALHALPFDLPLAALLAGATMNTLRWLAEAAGLDLDGPAGLLRLHALAALWAGTLRAWEKDESDDLAATMSALDRGLDRAERLGMLKPSRADHPTASAALPDLTMN